MTKDEIVHIAENLFEQAVRAKSYLQIIEQFRENCDSYNEEMNNSPAFYRVVYSALTESLFLNLFKLYDMDSNSLSVYKLLKGMRKISEDDLNDYVLEGYIKNGNRFEHRLSKDEEERFSKEVEHTKELCVKKNVPYDHTTVFVTLQNIIDLYNVRYRPLRDKVVDNLRKHRIKIGVHNDAMTNFDYKSVIEEFSITDNEIYNLVDFAIEFLQFCIEILTGVRKMPEYLNINDWGVTLNLVSDGMNYRKIINKEHKRD